VVEAEDRLPDLPALQVDTGRPIGNHIVVRCQDVYVLLADLIKGSLKVEPGQEGENTVLIGLPDPLEHSANRPSFKNSDHLFDCRS
jgi:hypothetical protein